MKYVTALILLLLLSSGRLFAQDLPLGVNCEMWRLFTEAHKIAFVGGYQSALLSVRGIIALAEQSTSPFTAEQVRIIETVRHLMWPQGHRVGSVILELNVFCDKVGSADKPLFGAMLQIAAEKNKK